MHPYTIRPVRWAHKEGADGTAPLMICITIQRRKTYFRTGLKVREEQWKNNQVAGHDNAVLYNRVLREKMAEIEADLLSRGLAGESLDASNIKDYRPREFFAFARQAMKNMPPATQRRYTCEINRLQAFAGDKLDLRQVTTAFLRDYERRERDRGQAQNTLNTTVKWLKAILNKARKEGLLRETPIYQTPKYVQPERIYLVEHERQAWLTHWRQKKVEGSLYTTLTWFLFGCYSGLRYSDWEHFHYQDRVEGQLLKLRAQKNGEWVVMPIGKTLAEIIEVVKDLPKPLSADKTRAGLKILAGQIGIARNVTTHTARHTAGAMFAQLGLPLAVAARLLGITEKVASVYYHLTGVDIIKQAAVLRDV